MIKLLRFLRPYRALLTLVIVLAFAQAMANLYLPTLFADIVDYGIFKGDTGYIWRTGAIMLVITLGGTIAAVVGIFKPYVRGSKRSYFVVGAVVSFFTGRPPTPWV